MVRSTCTCIENQPQEIIQHEVFTSHKIQSNTIQSDLYMIQDLVVRTIKTLLLQRAKQGEFIFRESPNREGELVLSMRHQARVRHFSIKQRNGWFCMGEVSACVPFMKFSYTTEITRLLYPMKQVIGTQKYSYPCHWR